MTSNFTDLEIARLDALSSYNVLDSLPEDDYDAITRIASQLCDMPISLITLLDDQRQWFKSAVGMSVTQTPRHYAFCDHAIRVPDQLMEVPDALVDERFVDNPLAVGDPHIRFYAGVPLVDDEGYALGTLCVIDNKPNKLTDQQATTLRLLARQVVSLLKLRRSQALLEDALTKLHTLNEKLEENNQILNLVVDNCPAGLILWQAVREQDKIVDFRYLLTNPFNAGVTGFSVEQMIGNTMKNLFPHVNESTIVEKLTTAVETGERQHYQQYDRFDQIDMWGDYQLIPLGDRVLLTYLDISRLKKNEEQLRDYSDGLEQLVAERTAEIGQLSALQNAILQYAGFAIFSTDTQGLIQTVNPAACQLLNYRSEELVGQINVATLCDSVALAAKALIISERFGRPVPADFSLFTLINNEQNYECTMVDKNGRHIPVLLVTTPLQDTDETTVGYVMMVTDITLLKTVRADLQQLNQELTTFFDVALDLHCIATTDGRILKTNRAWQNTLGYTAGELLAMNHFDLVHPHDREATRTVVSMGVPRHSYMSHLNRFQRKDGSYRVIEWNVVAIDGLLYASARDITDRQRAEKELKKMNQRLQLATHAAGQGIWEYDREQDVLIWDRQMFAIHGLDYRETPLQARDYLQLMHPEDYPILDHNRNPDSGVINYTIEIRIIRPDGILRYTELHGTNIFGKTGKSIGSVGIIRDITERKLADMQLKKLNQRLQLATQAAKQGIWEYDTEQDRLYWDEQMCLIHGLPYTGAPLRLEEYTQLIHPEDLPTYQQNRRQESVNIFINERRIIRPDGSIRYTELHGVGTTNKAGQLVGSVGVVHDITDRKLAELALRQSENRYRSLVDNMKDIVFQANLQGEWTFLNPGWTAITGYSIDESLGRPFYGFIPVEDQPYCQKLYAAFMDQGQESHRFVIRFQHQCGNYRWAEVFAQIATDETGQVTGTNGTITDITDRKQALDALRKSEQRFRDIAESINEIFWIHSTKPLRLLYVNPAYELVTGLPTEALYNNSMAFIDLVAEEDQPTLKAALKLYTQGKEISVQYRTRTASGSQRWFEIRTFVKKDSNGTPINYIGLATDITSQKEKESVLVQSLEREQELNRLKSQFVSTASHEFRTPLATIQSSVDLIKLYMDQPTLKSGPAMQRHLGIIEKEISNFSGLLADILTFGKIEAGKVPFTPQWVDVQALIESVITTHFSERTDRRIVQVSIEGSPRPIRADPTLLSHALVNLLSNAFKFSTNDTRLHAAFAGSGLTLTISDTGIGIPADDLTHLFETFFRARNAVNIQGSGLGLVITRQFIERHGGKLIIQSQENKGTTCTIVLTD